MFTASRMCLKDKVEGRQQGTNGLLSKKKTGPTDLITTEAQEKFITNQAGLLLYKVLVNLNLKCNILYES